MIKVDFHNHSICSDGLLSPSDMVKRAKANNVMYFALTDHDTVSGLKEATETAKKLNIQFIPGIELSTEYNNESVHVLGFFKDNSYNAPEFINCLNELKNARLKRAEKIIIKLKEKFNIEISYENVLKRCDGIIARPHIAYEIIDQGYPYDMDYIFNNFIGRDCAAYVPTFKLPTKNGIELLKKHNALAFLAHPILIKNSPVEELLKLDFDGIEAIYYQNTKEDEKRLINIAKIHNLLISAGSDCHGNFENDLKHGDVGDTHYSEEYLYNFLNSLKK